MKWCLNCVLPDTRPNIKLDSRGICNACRNHKTKSEINWEKRHSQLLDLVSNVKKVSNTYDCVIPVSGGKDSTWQTIKCLELGLKPLAVTWRPPGRNKIGQQNLDNLISLGVDHIDYSISPEVEAKFTLASFREKGSTAIPMHMALFNIPLKIACSFNIPLVVWGENSALEYGNKDEGDIGYTLDHKWLSTYGVTNGTIVSDWFSNELTPKELIAYKGPYEQELKSSGVKAIFLGYFLPWDPEITKSVATENGFKSDSSGPRTGYYAHADIDDDHISLHHWMKWYKFGFTRTFDNLSLEIRNKRIKRKDAIQIISNLGDETPHRDIESFCKFTGISKDQFYKIAERFRNTQIWKKSPEGVWYIPDFLISDKSW